MNTKSHWSAALAFGTTLTAAALTLSLCGCNGPTKQGLANREELGKHHNATIAALEYQSAEQEFRVGNLKQAKANIEHAIIMDPTDDKSFLLLGRILIEMNNLQAARQSLVASIEINENNADAHYYIGVIYQRWSKPEHAAIAYRQAHEIDPTSDDYGLAYLELLIGTNDLEGATAFLENTRVEFEHDPAFRVVEGHLNLIKGDPTKAAESFHQAMLLDPEDTAIVESLIHAYIVSAKFAEAEYYLNRLLSDPITSTRTDLKRLLARCLAASDQLIEAREVYLELTNINRSDLDSWYELAAVSLKMGEYRRVDKIARVVISSWPDRAEGYLLRGRVQEHRGELKEAIASYKEGAERDRANINAFLWLGMALEKDGAAESATKIYQHILKREPENLKAARLLSTMQSRTASVAG